MRIFLTVFWGVDAFGAPVVTVESYDRLGRLVRQRREFGAQIPQSFRTAYMDETGGYELSYAYDADGLRTEFVHPLGSSVYAYDAAGRMVKQTDITAYRLDGTAVTSESRVESSFEYNAVDALVRAQVSDLAGTWVREFGYRGAHMTSVTESPAEADLAVAASSEALHTEIIRDDLGRISGVDSPAGLVMYTYTDAQMLSSAVRGTETLRWTYDAAGSLVRVEYFDSAQPENAWVKVLVTDEGARVRAVCLYGVQDEAKAGSQSAAEFASAVEDAQAWLGQCPESVELEGVTLVPVATSVFSYDGNDSRLLQVSSDGSGSSLTYGAAGFVNSVASWGSAGDSAVSFSLLCASTDGRVLAAGGAPAGVPEFGVPSTGARANAGSASGFDASVMHPLVWDENSFVPRVLGVAGSSMPSVGSLVPGAGSGAGLLDPYGWDSLGVAAPAVPSAQGAGGAPVLPDSLVGVSAASGVVLGSSGFEVLGARVVDSRVARFTAPDPLVAPVGAGWGADPFSLVGGNPVSLVDSWGLSPVSVEDFDKFREERIRDTVTNIIKGALTVVGVVASVAAIFVTGGTALVVLGAIAGGTMAAANAIDENKDPNTGKVDWGNVAKSGVIGGIFGAISGGMGKWANGAATKLFKGAANGTGKLLASTPTRILKATGVRMTVEGIKGGVTSAVDGTKDLALNLATGGKHKYSPQEHALKVASGVAFSGLNSMISPVSGSLAKSKLSQAASKHIPGLSEKTIRKGIDVTATAASSVSQSAFESWGTGKEVRAEDLVWKGINSVKSRYGSYKAPAGNVGDPSTLKQMGSRPYTMGTYLNSASRSKSTQDYFDKKAQESVTKYANDKLHIKDIYDHYKKEKDKFNPGMDIPNDAKNNNTVGSQTHAGQGEK